MSECTYCKHVAKHGHEEPCVRCGTGKFSMFEPGKPLITQDAAYALLAAAEGMVDDDINAARHELEWGPGGTRPEREAEELIDRREAAVKQAIADAKGTP